MLLILIRGRHYWKILILLFVLILPTTVALLDSNPPYNFPNPIMFNCSIQPEKVQPGDIMTVSASLFDFIGIEKVEAQFFHEKGCDTIHLIKKSGSHRFGTWIGQWEVHDTLVKEYHTIITAYSYSGKSTSKTLNWHDPVAWWNTEWSNRKLITLSSSQVPNDLTNFPILINITDTDLRDDAQSDGDDIVFTDSSGNKLNHEIENYTSGTGNLIAWINVTSLSSSSDTQIYIYYGNSGCSSQQNVASTWDSGYVGVWHFNDGKDVGSFSDSTSNDNDGSASGSAIPTWTTSGRIGGAYTFDGDDRVATTITTAFTDFSVNLWFKNDGDTRSYERLADKNYQNGFWFGRSGTTETWGGGVRESAATTPFDFNPVIASKNGKKIVMTTPLFQHFYEQGINDHGRIAATVQMYVAKGLFSIAKNHSNSDMPIVVSGGVVYNKMISDFMIRNKVFVNVEIPSGDGGICYGQTYVANKTF